MHAPGRGATAWPTRESTTTQRFNSRTREGCDDFDLFVIEMGDDVSIHAPGRGATGLQEHLRPRCNVSIHAPGRGATVIF